MASVGSAVVTAANMLRNRFIRTAVIDPESPLNGLRPEDVAVTDGRMFTTTGPKRGESYQDLLSRRGWPGLDSEQTWTPDDADKRYSMNAYGAVFAEVVVDTLLATVRIRRICGCYDAGRVINPKLAHSQAIGGMVGGIEMALWKGPNSTTVTAGSSTRTCPITWFQSTPTSPRWTRPSYLPRIRSPTRWASRDSANW
jgi:xanthine dehydrogenase YagR molybdenum-binding subunit